MTTASSTDTGALLTVTVTAAPNQPLGYAVHTDLTGMTADAAVESLRHLAKTFDHSSGAYRLRTRRNKPGEILGRLTIHPNPIRAGAVVITAHADGIPHPRMAAILRDAATHLLTPADGILLDERDQLAEWAEDAHDRAHEATSSPADAPPEHVVPDDRPVVEELPYQGEQ